MGCLRETPEKGRMPATNALPTHLPNVCLRLKPEPKGEIQTHTGERPLQPHAPVQLPMVPRINFGIIISFWRLSRRSLVLLVDASRHGDDDEQGRWFMEKNTSPLPRTAATNAQMFERGTLAVNSERLVLG